MPDNLSHTPDNQSDDMRAMNEELASIDIEKI
jgi:hypothetical protein